MQVNHVVRIREDSNHQKALTIARALIADTAHKYHVPIEDLEELVLLQLMCNHAAIPFELREPEGQEQINLKN